MSEATFRIMCPKLTCRRILAVPVSARGKTVRCRNCGTSIRVPTLTGDFVPEEGVKKGKKKKKAG